LLLFFFLSSFFTMDPKHDWPCLLTPKGKNAPTDASPIARIIQHLFRRCHCERVFNYLRLHPDMIHGEHIMEADRAWKDGFDYYRERLTAGRFTLLHAAVVFRSTPFFDFLIEQRADVSAVSGEGRSVLSYTIHQPYFEDAVLRLLGSRVLTDGSKVHPLVNAVLLDMDAAVLKFLSTRHDFMPVILGASVSPEASFRRDCTLLRWCDDMRLGRISCNLIALYRDNQPMCRARIRFSGDYPESYAAKMFALVVLVSDGYLAASGATAESVGRFFAIVGRLPPEMQMVACNRGAGLCRDTIPPEESALGLDYMSGDISPGWVGPREDPWDDE
jgi:hypothetical protein